MLAGTITAGGMPIPHTTNAETGVSFLPFTGDHPFPPS